jgi:hypothetical protein
MENYACLQIGTLSITLQKATSERRCYSFESPHVRLNPMSLHSHTLLISPSLPWYLLPPTTSTSLYYMPALCLKIHEAAYVLSPTPISILSFLHAHPPTCFLLEICRMPIYPYETDTKTSQLAPSLYIKNYFNPIDYIRMK